MEYFVGPDAGESHGRTSRQRSAREAIDRMQAILDTGRWPSGVEVLPYERPIIAKNLAAMRRATPPQDPEA